VLNMVGLKCESKEQFVDVNVSRIVDNNILSIHKS
jgi:hypothetical protein